MDRYDFYIKMPHTFSFEEVVPSIWNKDGIVIGVSASADRIYSGFDQSLAGILNKFGRPEEIWLRVDTEGLFGVPFYQLSLFYPAQGIAFYGEKDGKLENNIVVICPHDYGYEDDLAPSVLLFPLNNQLGFYEMWDIFFGSHGHEAFDSYSFGPHGLLENVADNFFTGDFYQTYKNPKASDCFYVNPNK